MTENALMDEKVQKAATTLATMLDYLGLDATVKSQEKNGRISLIAVSEDAGRIIGRKGRTLDDLQLLINKMMQRGNEISPRIMIDVDGYSKKPLDSEFDGPHDRGGRGNSYGRHHDRRDERGERDDRDSRRGDRFLDDERDDHDHDEQIRQNAIDAAKEVKRWGESVSLPPMNSHDRRIIHVTLKEDNEIQTESREADNPKLKSVIISLRDKNSSEKPVLQD